MDKIDFSPLAVTVDDLWNSGDRERALHLIIDGLRGDDTSKHFRRAAAGILQEYLFENSGKGHPKVNRQLNWFEIGLVKDELVESGIGEELRAHLLSPQGGLSSSEMQQVARYPKGPLAHKQQWMPILEWRFKLSAPTLRKTLKFYDWCAIADAAERA